MARKRTVKCAIMLGLLIAQAGLGIALIYWQNKKLQQHEDSLRWPAVTGTILSSEALHIPRSRSPENRADIMYRYSVNDVKYTSHQISLWSGNLAGYSTAMIKPFVASHPRNGSTKVYYDPQNPTNAVLVPGPNERQNWLGIIGGIFLIVVAVLGVPAQLRQEQRLSALLNNPARESLIITLNRADVEKAQNFALRGVIAVFILGSIAVLSVLPPLLSGPLSLPGSRPVLLWQWLVAGVCGLVAVVLFKLAKRRERGALCPLCGDSFAKQIFETKRCSTCESRITFGDKDRLADRLAEEHDIPGAKKSKPATDSSLNRLIDVIGFTVFPIALICLLDASSGSTRGLKVLCFFPILLGILYYFFPENVAEKIGWKERDERKKTTAKPYVFDFSIILSPVLGLLAYLLPLIWYHKTLDVRRLSAIIVLFPSAVAFTSYVYYRRGKADRGKKSTKSPACVPLTVYSLWLAGMFISVVFIVILLIRLQSPGDASSF